MSYLDIEQRSAAWIEIRLGKVTASRVADIVARTKTGYSTSRANYLAELLCERMSGQQYDSYVSPAMQWGTDQEPEARLAYEFRTDAAIEEVGFIPHPAIEMSGASPDALVGDEGLAEIKCPNTSTHIETLLTGVIPSRYETQMLWQMACTGRAWCDFASFDPRLPEEMRLFVKRFHRDDARIAELEEEVRTFLFELDTTVRRLVKLYGGERTAA
jgi:putative phage-type endonuclease